MVKKKKKAATKRKKTLSRSKRAVKKAVRKAGKPGARRPAKKKAPAKKARVGSQISPEATLEKIGEVTHYFPHVKAAAILLLKDSLRVGDEIYIKGHTTNFKEKVKSIQLDRAPIPEGRKGQEIGLLVKSRVRSGDSVYKV
jgi:hypothetical protein